ncbi:16S rRNA (cytosine(967)-C(5))-methyltransferase RsmB [Thermoanaerobacterium sp. RBIITD]|uniref:16S rRNA (cytosine(967)-C(5))-methyltransferase RsmB n=1 Tax=Thermoanaerobacterium sp. RBIITD TaxID=1550240 RepID=UPI000BB6AE32|nr:16S rRNA (cytosine(967)-C(5))-methyltransferase RsmB [Thermoanaerobacterium sp. RBIITD]SNX55594.1 16S rRNA (cytosine967-C5)-methyltransferase [Thermoanaerobacterium sp. RBIITD]
MNSRDIAFKILYDIIVNKGYSNIILNKYLSNSDITDVDKNFIKEIVFGTIERKYTIDYVINILAKSGIENIDSKVLIILEMGLYQIKYMDKVPDYAVINESVNLTKRYVGKYASKFVNALLRNYLRKLNLIEFPDQNNDIIKYLCVNFSFPEWIVERLLNNYDKNFTIEILKSLNEKPRISYRLNTLKFSPLQFENELKSKGLHYSKGLYYEEAYYIDIKNVDNNELYKNGLIQVQDEGSMLISKILSPKHGETVIDVCSAPGGKTTHLSQLMENSGNIIAFDKHQHKINLINKNCKRLGINNVMTMVFDSTKVNSDYIDKADKVLVDVPCTGIGIIRKKPDIKLKNYTKNDIDKLNNLQYLILNSSSKYVKKGGYLVYSTCTIGKEENFDIVDRFLNENNNFSIVNLTPFLPDILRPYVNEKGYIQLLPNINHIDGFFVCKIQRNV